MKRTAVIISLLIIIAVMLASIVLLKPTQFDTHYLKESKQQIAQSESQVKLIDKEYQQKMSLFKHRGDSLQNELNKTQVKLQVAKAKLNQSETTVLHFAKKDTAHESISQQLSDCDSLKTQVLAFACLMDSTRNIYECNIMQLQNKVAIRDSELLICRSSYTEMKNLMDENLERERKLTEDLQIAYKQQRKKVIQSKLLAGGFLLLSGITTTLYLNSKK
jgi:uncharacterized protein YxeA